ncbi:MAG TPA: sugar ABC transporter permease [Trueperaceae bacterium]
MLLPAVIWIVALTIFPLLYSLWIAFTSQRLGVSGQWIGFDNFARALTDERFLSSLRFTAFFVIVAVAIEMVLGFALALLLDTVVSLRGIVRTIWTMPLFATPVAIAYLGLTLFNETGGPINSLLASLGLPGVPWLSSVAVAPWTVVLLDVWQWTPFVVLILFAALQSVSVETIEAARVDGAGPLALVRYVLLPLLRPAIVTVVFLRFTDAVKMFDFSFALTGGGPGTSTEVASLYVYRRALQDFNLGYGAALAYILFVLALVVGLTLLAQFRRTSIPEAQG